MHMKARSYTCAYHTSDGDMITGDSNGTVYIWPCGSNSLSNLIKHAHEVRVFIAILTMKGRIVLGNMSALFHSGDRVCGSRW